MARGAQCGAQRVVSIFFRVHFLVAIRDVAARGIFGAGPPDADVFGKALLVDRSCAFDDCPTQPGSLNLLQLRGQKKVAASSDHASDEDLPAAGDDRDARVNAIIQEVFENITGPGHYLAKNIKVDVTWEACTRIDWTAEKSYADQNAAPFSSNTKELKAMIEGLGLLDCSAQGRYAEDDTCKAIQAAIHANRVLARTFADGPRFVNYSIVAWGDLPSWREGTVASVDYSVMPPHAKVLDPNGANAYGLCDIVRTVLTQSPNQMATGSCGYMASLAALSHKAPAKAIKMGLRLMWTGRSTPSITPPCPYIFAQQPGLIPFRDKDGTWRPRSASSSQATMCAGNAADCQRAKGAPSQNAGFAFMWSQSLIASFYNAVSSTCSGDGPAKLLYPGIDRRTVATIKGVQGQNLGSALWSCNEVIDPEGRGCRFGINLNTCGPISDDDCKLLKSYEFDDDQAAELLHALNIGLIRGETDLIKAAEPVTSKYRPMREFITFYSKIATDHGASTLTLKAYQLISLIVESTMKPQGTEDMLEQACRAEVAMLVVDANPLKPIPGVDEDPSIPRPTAPFDPATHITLRPKGSCDHAVYLVNCDRQENVYTLWSWGYRIYVTKELLLGRPIQVIDPTQAKIVRNVGATFSDGILCNSVFSDRITFAGLSRNYMEAMSPFA